MTQIEYGHFYFAQEIFSLAEEQYTSALEKLGTEDVTILPVIKNLIVIYQSSNRTTEANELKKIAETLCE